MIKFSLLKLTKDDNPTFGQRLGLLGGGLMAVSGRSLLNRGLVRKMVSLPKEEITDEAIQDALSKIVTNGPKPGVLHDTTEAITADMLKHPPGLFGHIIKYMKNSKGLTDEQIEHKLGPILDVLAAVAPAMYSPNTHRVYVNKGHALSRLDVLAHEMGHSANHNFLRGFRGGKALSNLASLAAGARQLSVTSTTLAPIIQAMRSKNPEDISYTPAMINLGVHTPILMDEIGASTRAAKYLSRGEGLLKGLSRGKALFPALGTYLLSAGLPLATTAALRKIREYQQRG